MTIRGIWPGSSGRLDSFAAELAADDAARDAYLRERIALEPREPPTSVNGHPKSGPGKCKRCHADREKERRRRGTG